MGYYTRLVLNVALDNSNPSLISTIRSMIDGSSQLEGRLSWMLSSSSYYHDNIQHSSLEFDDISECHKLSVVCDLKNYDNEINTFLLMIAPVAQDCFGGYSLEENTVPTLFWFLDGKLIEHTPVLPDTVLKQFEIR